MRTGPKALLYPDELIFVLRRGILVALVGLLAVGAAFSRWSPLSLDRAAALAAGGDAAAAVDAYLEIARSAVSPKVRDDAAWQAALLASVDGHDPQRAVELLRSYAHTHPDTDRAAQALDRLGTLYQLYLQDPIRAAEAWQAAAAAAPDSPRVGRWQLDAGLAYLDAGLRDRAAAALQEAADHDSTFVAAKLALGRMALVDDPAAAYDHYSQALGRAQVDADRSLARLGIATALEALDRVPQALAELEDGDDDPALQRRRARLQARDHP
ncbi:MAG: hypothetical protein D6798_03010 [Deltaproteobacteria bacterium]|nr:MAG: hypothetical protein D6798_03010 [Deltaproteobacteria bacterium]